MIGVLVVYTVIVTLNGMELCARFCQTSVLKKRTRRCTIVGKQVSVTFNKQKGLCRQFKRRTIQPRIRNNIHSIYISGLCSGTNSPRKEQLGTEPVTQASQQSLLSVQDIHQNFTNNSSQIYDSYLPSDATEQQISLWLQNHRFSSHLRTFSNYSGADLLRLSRDDLIQICGLADGIRLFNALHTKAKTIYLCVKSSPTVYHATYLASLSSKEMTAKIAILLGITSAAIYRVYMLGPHGILILVSDELVINLKDGSAYRVETMEDCPSDRLSIILKPSTN